MTDEQRYLEYLQRHIMPQGWDAVFDAGSDAQLMRDSNRWKEDPAYCESKTAKEHAQKLVDAFTGQTKFDSALTNATFRPILTDLLAEADTGPWKKLGHVQLLSSTDPGPTPVARPSSVGHTLLIGKGTMSYCNHWAKVFAPIVVRLFVQEQTFRVRSDTEVETAARGSPDSIALAGALCIYFALFGTTIGFGRVTSLPEHLQYRMELVTAMERFIVAHELSHFIAFQELPGADGMLGDEDAKTIEQFCDDVGLALSRAAAAEKGCLLGRSGVAPMLFFRTIECADQMRRRMGSPDRSSGTHPTCEERIQLIRRRVLEFDNDKEGLLQMLEFYDAVCSSVLSLATQRIADFVVAESKD